MRARRAPQVSFVRSCGHASLEEPRKDEPENYAADVRQVRNTGGFVWSDLARVPDLQHEPQADEDNSWDVRDPYEDNDDQYGANLVGRERCQKRTHHRRDRAAGAEIR